MTLSLNLSGLAPYLLLAWIGAVVLAVTRSFDKYRGRLHAPLLLYAAWQFMSTGLWFTIGIVGYDAYLRKLLSVGSLILIIVLTLLVLAGTDWLIGRAYARHAS
jgi:hypothetical protein